MHSRRAFGISPDDICANLGRFRSGLGWFFVVPITSLILSKEG